MWRGSAANLHRRRRCVPFLDARGAVARTIHIGPYHLLSGAHSAILDWCAEANVPLAGPNWEIYGHWTDDPSQLRTDVCYLLRSTGRT